MYQTTHTTFRPILVCTGETINHTAAIGVPFHLFQFTNFVGSILTGPQMRAKNQQKDMHEISIVFTIGVVIVIYDNNADHKNDWNFIFTYGRCESFLWLVLSL